MRIKFHHLIWATFCFASLQTVAQQTAKMTSTGIGYLEYLPQGYKTNSNNYPVVISLHGIKEKGNTLSDVARVANVGLPKYVKYGQNYSFILISPQLKTSMSRWTGDYVMQVINHVRKTLRIDKQRIYLTGLSLGGGGVWSVATAYPSVFAAILPICSGYNTLSSASKIAGNNIATWGFHGDKDYTVHYSVTQKMINAINACTPKPSPLAKFTIFPGMGHIIWDKVYKETSALSWLLTFKNGTTSTAPTSPETTNKLPVVSAGSDKSTSNTGFTIVGSASDSDGNIASYKWTKVSGPSVSMSNATTSKLWASSLVSGTYYFRLTATDNDGGQKYDDMKLVVSNSLASGTSSTNVTPVVSAGSDKSTTSTGFTVVGSASDRDGYIASYKWTKVSGPSANMSNTTSSKLWASNLSRGTYYFRLTVKDNGGAVKYDDMKLNVY